jgi:hypothetical protein
MDTWGGNGVPAGGTERSTAGKPTHCECKPTERAVGLECLDGVRRARRCEPARRRPTLDRTLVPGHEDNESGAGRASCRSTDEIRLVISCSSWVNDSPTMPGRAPIRYQPAGNCGAGDGAINTARSRRRSRLRTTDEPMARPTANATRGGEADGSLRKLHQRTPARARRPSRDNRAKTSRSRMRQIKPTACGGPWHGGPSGRPDPPGCSSGGESRASWHDDDCSAGRCASRNPPRQDEAREPRRDKWLVARCGNDPLRGKNLNRLGPRCAVGNTVVHSRAAPRPWAGVLTGLLACSSRQPVPAAAGSVVHMVWTTMWKQMAQDRGGAGERR